MGLYRTDGGGFRRRDQDVDIDLHRPGQRPTVLFSGSGGGGCVTVSAAEIELPKSINDHHARVLR